MLLIIFMENEMLIEENEILIQLRTGNAAFQDGNFGAEVARILRKLADKCEGYTDYKSFYEYADIPIKDVNGNTVGDVTTQIEESLCAYETAADKFVGKLAGTEKEDFMSDLRTLGSVKFCIENDLEV